MISYKQRGVYMIKDKIKFIKIFAIAFASTVVFALFMVFVVLRGMFAGIYISKGNASYEAGNYDKAIEAYNTSKTWKAKNQEVYILLAKTYAAKEDFESAGEIIETAIEKKITTKDSGLEQLYLMRIKIYSAAGQLTEAVNYTDNLNDQYILKRIQAVRPSDLTYTPTQGSYDKTLKMSIDIREGETVYYTTDGSAPTKYSTAYTNPINIANGTTQVTAISVDAQGLVSPMLSVTYTVTNENQAVEFDDPKIEKMVRNSLSKPSGTVRVRELESVTELTNEGVDGLIKTLSDLELMPNLESVYLDGETAMISISQLSGKAKLKYLSLSNCELDSSEINSLGSLTALETLDLTGNSITSVSVLTNMTALKYVYLTDNFISDISALVNAKELEFIDAMGNKISELPDFDTDSKIKTLCVSNNDIRDISTLHRLTELTFLDLSGNDITSCKNLTSLTKLESLSLADNPITNFDFLSSLTSLTSLDVMDTKFINTKPLSALKLKELYASNTGISSLKDIENCTDLITLEIANTNVTDLSPLAKLTSLDYLDISGCAVTDFSPLTSLTELYTLVATDVDLNGTKFANENINIIQQ